TYPLPEAQLDRFLFKLIVPFPSAEELTDIVLRTTAGAPPALRRVADGPAIIAMGRLAREVPIARPLTDYVVRLTLATHPEANSPEIIRRMVRYGVSPRAAQAIVTGAKIRALTDGRLNVAFEDIRAVALPALRHRLILTFEAEAAGKTADDVLTALLDQLPHVG
ncbi:MAG: AAA family ATPase, partial [Thermomicrobiales bacterium]